ncbi:MAG TPA: sigma-54 dependent transcriptional regulator [Saprospiraceae bacterium]|nr:sigma-54 dependent transcriptional regulator [Saprospiraceae bacterium]HMP25658.1 sigma-54 dependent transcriptional regulator [Saprospiraceae bacterium]
MILIIDDDIAVQTSLSLLLRQHGFEVALKDGPAEALSFLRRQRPELILLDLNFTVDTTGREGFLLFQQIRELEANVPVILITGWGSIELAVQGMKLGAKDFISKPWSNEHLLQAVRTALQLAAPQPQSPTRRELNERYDLDHIIGEDPELLKVLETIVRVADTNASVLILGESGTGKELIAEAIHQNSRRRQKPFVKVNLGGIPSSLFESELFGHKRGAFTDARTDRTGRFEMAHTGTIFLDEIGDLDRMSQVKLLRVLQDHTFEVLGSSQSKNIDVRVVSATNRNLADMVATGDFREDLFYRINLITIELPPLRERPGDIPLLAQFFINNLKSLYNRPDLRVSKAALNWLKTLTLPGNIRQLKNLVERTVLVTFKDELDVADFQKHFVETPKSLSNNDLPEVGSMTLEKMEIEMIKKAMTFHNNRVVKVAKALGLTRSALYRRLEKYDIPFE